MIESFCKLRSKCHLCRQGRFPAAWQAPVVCPHGEKPDLPSRGLGDTVAKVLDATGIGPLVKKMMKKPCGCAKRQAALNRLVPYGE